MPRSAAAVVGITELRASLPDFVSRAEAGGEVRIARHGKIVARIVSTQNQREDAKAILMKLRKRATVGDVEAPIDIAWNANDADS